MTPHLPAQDVEWRPDDYIFPTDLASVFGRKAPIEVDAGCGDGAFLVAMAKRHPERNFLGIERLLGRVRRVGRRAAKARATNVRVLRLETAYSIRYLLPPSSISVLYLLFPDPWPKRRHHDRRLFDPEFARSVANALLPGGELRVKTDHAEYFKQIITVAEAEPRFEPSEWIAEPDEPLTDFEKHYIKEGRPVYRACFGRTDVP